jgi:hypothetical protein
MERAREEAIVADMMALLHQWRADSAVEGFEQSEESVRAVVRRFAAVDEIGDAAARLETERGARKTEIWNILAPYLLAAGGDVTWTQALRAMSADDRRALETVLRGASIAEALDLPDAGRSLANGPNGDTPR